MFYRIFNKINRILQGSEISKGSILMLHRINDLDDSGLWFNQHLKLSPKSIEQMTEYAHSKGCSFVSLDEVIRPKRFWKRRRKLIAITLDDGYRDNYTNGKVIFDKLNIPYCIYVCIKMVEGQMLYWWEILEKLCLDEDEIEVKARDGSIRFFDCSTKEKKEQSFLDIREIILQLPQDNLLDELKVLFSKYDIDYSVGNDTLGLTWPQLRELSEDPLCTIGNHTYSHKSFTGCTDEEIINDIQLASKCMKENIGIDLKHFAFPFGEASAVSPHDIELVKNLGFKTSATTNHGLISRKTDPLELPRIFVTERNWKEVIDLIVDNC